MRRQPVAFFLGDASFPADAKFRHLARLLPDADAFNSAVGAYFVALAAARRNGEPVLDLEAETGSSYLPDLITVGLLVPDGFPVKAFREWAPSRPKRPSESAVSSVSNVSSGVERVESAVSVAPSPPLPSIPLNSSPLEGGAGGSGDPADIYWTLTGRYPSGRPLRWLDDLTATYSAEAVIRALGACALEDRSPATLLGRVRDVLLRDARRLDQAEREAEQARVVELRKPTVLRRLPENVTPEEADAAAAAYLAEHGRGGAA